LRLIKKAGFKDVSILDESCFPIDCMATDPIAKVIMKDVNIPPEKLGRL